MNSERTRNHLCLRIEEKQTHSTLVKEAGECGHASGEPGGGGLWAGGARRQ